MTNEEIIKKINGTLKQVHEHFEKANKEAQKTFDEKAPEHYKTDRFGLRNWWLNEYRTKTRNINMFSFNADDIIKFKIPSQVVGCSGRADLFAKYATENGLDVNVVVMVDIADKNKEYPNGHQIIAVKFPDGSQQLIDPGAGRDTYDRAKIAGRCNIGEYITYNRKDGRKDYEITAILTPDRHAKIDGVEKLARIYKNPQINPAYCEILTAISLIVNELQNPKTGLNSLQANILKSLNGQDLKELNETIKNKIGRHVEIKPLQYIKMILQHFVIQKIQENEKNKENNNPKTKNTDQFKAEIAQEIEKNIATIGQLSKDELIAIIDKHNNVREALNEKPEIFTKYGISTSCSNAATAFVYELKEHIKKHKLNINPDDDICYLDTTRWDHLQDGHAGHVVPCVRLDKDNWIMIEPLHETIDVGIPTKIIPESDLERGQSLEHLMAHRKDEPYMITAKSKEPCTDHKEFLENVSSVSLDEAKAFLKLVSKETEKWPEETLQKIRQEYETISQKQLSSWKTGIKRIKQKINSINLRDMFAFSKSQETHE